MFPLAFLGLSGCGSVTISLSVPLTGAQVQTGSSTTASGSSSSTSGSSGSTATMAANDPNCVSETDTWSSYAEGFFQTNCANCHGTTFSTLNAVQSDEDVETYLSTGTMPQNATLDPNTKARILLWFECGSPQ